jgi:hypothetical protein
VRYSSWLRAAGILIVITAAGGLFAWASRDGSSSHAITSTPSVAVGLSGFFHVGGSQKGLPGVLRCRVLDIESLECDAVPSGAHGTLYTRYGEWHHTGPQEGLLVLVSAPPATPGAHQTMIANGRLGALACPKTTLRTRTCWPVNGSPGLTSGDLGIYIRKQL